MTTNDHLHHDPEYQAVLDEPGGVVRRDTPELGEVSSLLLACLRQEPVRHEGLAFLDDRGWESILRMARQQDVASLLCDRLLSREMVSLVPEPARATLVDTRQRSAARNLVLLHDAGRAVAAMQTRGIPVIVLKGVHLATDVYANAALRRMLDIDLLVAPGDVAAASETLQAEGYTPATPIDARGDAVARYDHHLPRLMKAEHAGIEVHWRLGPLHAHGDVPGLWARARPTRVGGTAALALCPEDAVLHLCGHASYQHKLVMGLRPLCDIAETIRRYGGRLDWPSLVSRAGEWRWNRGVYVSLRLARAMVGAAVPDEVLLTLQPPGFDARVMTAARAITLRHRRAERMMSLPMANFALAESVRGKARTCLRRVFVPRSRIAEAYALPESSPWVTFYYAVRLKDLLTRHGRTALRLLRGDPALRSIASQRISIDAWLSAPDDQPRNTSDVRAALPS